MDFLEESTNTPQNPFSDNASKYENFLYRQQMQIVGWLSAVTKSVEDLEKRVANHERAHNVASAQAMRIPDSISKEEKPS